MKTAQLPPVRVTPSIRAQIESVLHEGESLFHIESDSLVVVSAIRHQREDDHH